MGISWLRRTYEEVSALAAGRLPEAWHPWGQGPTDAEPVAAEPTVNVFRSPEFEAYAAGVDYGMHADDEAPEELDEVYVETLVDDPTPDGIGLDNTDSLTA